MGRAPPDGRLVLIVDDDPEVRDILTLALEDEGYDVRAAEDGEAGWEILGRWCPHLILLDLMMPRVDGWRFRARQVAQEECAHIPVVVMTAGST